jgi:2-C-methyl-D-erythritol 4-phosphate cytidylyltransferase
MVKNLGPVTAVLLGGGSGERFGGDLPKQFLALGGIPLLVHSLRALEACDKVNFVVVVLPDVRPGFIENAVRTPKVRSVVSGGDSRQASLREGLERIPAETSIVLVHDAVRPLVTPNLLERVLEGVGGVYQGVVCAVPMEDALKEVSADHELLASKERRSLWRAQTPQAFLRDALEESLSRAEAEEVVCEDCSELLLRAGHRVRVVPGDPSNIKVTTPEDLLMGESLLAGSSEGAAGGQLR